MGIWEPRMEGFSWQFDSISNKEAKIEKLQGMIDYLIFFKSNPGWLESYKPTVEVCLLAVVLCTLNLLFDVGLVNWSRRKITHKFEPTHKMMKYKFVQHFLINRWYSSAALKTCFICLLSPSATL